jgi:hypothetical protein
MKPRTEKSLLLYDVTLNLNTDWTANRMLGYLSHYKKLPMEEVADEMLSILSCHASERKLQWRFL